MLVVSIGADNSSEVTLAAEEIQALQILRKHVPEAARTLVHLMRSPNESQRRQAIDLIFKHALVDREQQLTADGKAIPTNQYNIQLNKVDIRLIEVMNKLPPELQSKYADLMDEIDSWAKENEQELFDGEVEEIKLCKCGCGLHARWNKQKKKYNDYLHGHHFRGEGISESIREARRQGARRMKERNDLIKRTGMDL